MAGGKETPRQKMIGMMYLVLTALLALQVSNAVLEKFAIIEATLTEMLHQGGEKNRHALRAIIEEAGKSQNARVVHAKENAQKVRDLTVSTLAYIEQLKKRFMEMSGSDKVDEKIINDHSSKVASFMMKNPEGKKFETMLNDYVAKLKEYSGLGDKEFPTLARAPKDMEMFAGDTDHANKDFLTFTFENTPVIAALASVTQIQTEILEYETRALDELLKQAGVGKVSFDNIVPMVRAKQSVVAAGATYEADLFISASSSSFIPEMYKDGQKLDLFDDATGVKMGKIKFTAQGGGYDPATGLAKKHFSTKIQLPDTALVQEIEYFVAEPVIKVTTGKAPTLYMNCGNSVNIEVPSLGTNYNPSFTTAGGELIKGDKPQKVTIIPKSRQVKVTVANSGATLGSVNFDVKPIPRPRYVVKDNNNRDIDMKNGVRGSALVGLRVVAEAEENFKNEVPADANYRIRKMTVAHVRNGSAINKGEFTNENVDVGRWRSQFKAGDLLVIEIENVIRRTYKNEEERVEVRSEIYRVPLN
ncbi:MAG TPA: gliding motility protein GldM [Chryseosolibacter sp.]|nr:gliding motility protein GldM [Chryseosolibacter sp.]